MHLFNAALPLNMTVSIIRFALHHSKIFERRGIKHIYHFHCKVH